MNWEIRTIYYEIRNIRAIPLNPLRSVSHGWLTQIQTAITFYKLVHCERATARWKPTFLKRSKMEFLFV